jgi:hypothetical protein
LAPAGRQYGTVPWPVSELVRLYAVNAIALVAVVASWFAAAGTVRSGSQVTAIAVGVAALVCSGGVNAMWLLVGRRAVAMRRAVVREQLERVTESLVARSAASSSRPTPSTRSLVVVDRGTKYHRADCDLVAGKVTREWSSANGKDPRVPCGVCRP